MSNFILLVVGLLVVIFAAIGVFTAKHDDPQEQFKKRSNLRISEMERRAEHRRNIG